MLQSVGFFLSHGPLMPAQSSRVGRVLHHHPGNAVGAYRTMANDPRFNTQGFRESVVAAADGGRH